MKKNFSEYDPSLVLLARAHRKHGTLGEVIVWRIVRKKKVANQRFLRQRPIGRYIVDFVCFELRLILEVDGSSHESRYEQDQKRQATLEAAGFKVIRLAERFVRFRTPEAADTILKVVENRVRELKNSDTLHHSLRSWSPSLD